MLDRPWCLCGTEKENEVLPRSCVLGSEALKMKEECVWMWAKWTSHDVNVLAKDRHDMQDATSTSHDTRPSRDCGLPVNSERGGNQKSSCSHL